MGIFTFVLQDGDKVEVVAEDGHEVVVRGGDDGWDVRCTRGLALSLKEVVTDGPAHHTAPMLLHKHLPMMHWNTSLRTPKKWGHLSSKHYLSLPKKQFLACNKDT